MIVGEQRITIAARARGRQANRPRPSKEAGCWRRKPDLVQCERVFQPRQEVGRAPKMMGLTVCLLTRDEELKIGRAIASVRNLADQVVVVDTGSKDRTVEVAKAGRCRGSRHRLGRRFLGWSKPSLDLATNDWILWLNPDEELWPESQETLSECVKSEDALGFVVTIRDQMRADRPEEWSESLDLRLFRNRPDLRDVGRVHPSFPEAAISSASAEGLNVSVSSLILRRHAYESTLDESKLRWALRLLNRELEDRPEGLGYLIEKGDTLLRLNDPTGHEVMAQAAENVAKSRDAEQADSNAVQLLLNYIMRVPADFLQGPLTPDDAEALVLKWFPASPVPIWTVAERAFLKKDFSRASNLLEVLIRLGQTGLYDRSRGFDPSILNRHSWANLGACYLEMGQLDQAQTCFQHLRNDPVAREQAEQGLAVVAARRQQSARPEPGR